MTNEDSALVEALWNRYFFFVSFQLSCSTRGEGERSRVKYNIVLRSYSNVYLNNSVSLNVFGKVKFT